MPNAFGGDQSDADYAPHLNTEKKKKIVHPVKEKMYSKEEHIVNLTKYRLHYEQFRKDSYFGPNEKEIADWSNKWIEQNL